MDHSAHEEEEIPIPMSSTYVGGRNHTTIHENNHQVPNSTNGPLPLSTATMECNSRKGVVVKYKECLKNHAASIGGNATDGCGEFMPSGGEGTLEALKCSACNCHRNFHRREVDGESSYECYHHLSGGRMGSQRGLLVPGPEAFGYHPRAAPHHMIMPLGAALQTQEESDEMEGGVVARTTPMVKKRFRTKFTAEQKERMLAFAEKVGWRLQKLEDSVVQQVCQEIGVKRRVLKVWMHNNKHNLAKKNTDQPE